MHKSKSAKNMITKNIPTSLTPEEVYKISKRQNDWGIPGYEVPRQYYDYHQVMWHKRREKILSSHRRVWPPYDWPGDKEDPKIKHPPKRASYLDELEKWCKSYYDPKRARELIEEQNIDVKEYQPKKEVDKKRRREFLENERKKEEWKKSRPDFPEYKESAMEAVKEQIEEDKKAKEVTYVEKMLARYKGRPATARCDRVTIVADAEFVGEQIPFYNTPAAKDGETTDPKKRKLFYPDKTTTTGWYRAPAWRYPKPVGGKNPMIKIRDDEHKEKVDEYMQQKGLKKEDLQVDIRKSFYNVTHHGNILYKMVPRTEYEKEEHYKQSVEQNPVYSVGPDHYWRMPKETKNPKQYKKMLQEMTDDKGNKVYYMDRRKTDKFVYKTGMRKSVY